MAGPIGVHVNTWLREKLIGVRAKVVTLRLDQIGGQTFATVTIVECQGCAKARQRYAEEHAVGYNFTPRRLTLVNFSSEELVDEEVFDGWILLESLLDLAEELTANDATAFREKREKKKILLDYYFYIFPKNYF